MWEIFDANKSVAVGIKLIIYMAFVLIRSEKVKNMIPS